MTESALRQLVVDTAVSYLGCKESDGSHKKIIDIYNSQSPLPVGYKVTYSDAWCAAFCSAVAVELGLTDIIFPECGCGRMIDLYKAKGRWKELDSYVPSPADLIMYDWDDSGSGDNTGGADHVGFVVSVSGSTIKVIEGNKSDSVAYRSIAVNGRYIRGYCLPDYASKADGYTATTTTTTQLAVDGQWGSATTKRLQTIFGTTVDGTVSNQDAKYKSVNPGLVGGWDWKTKPNGKGSALIKAMQKWAGMTTANQDGEIGPVTIKAFQKKLGTTVDGKVSNPSLMVKALQKWANEQ